MKTVVVGKTMKAALEIARRHGISRSDGYHLVTPVSRQLYGARYDRAIVDARLRYPVDRTEREDRWFVSELLCRMPGGVAEEGWLTWA